MIRWGALGLLTIQSYAEAQRHDQNFQEHSEDPLTEVLNVDTRVILISEG